MVLVFQYGSNLSSERINANDRLQGNARLAGIAYTEEDFELKFTVWSKSNNCAVADIVPGSGGKIWGIMYEIPDYLIRRETSGYRKSLDAIEGEGQNYKRITIVLRYPDGRPFEQKVITYVGMERKSGIHTSLKYASYIIMGLREHNMPREYVDYVKEQVIRNNPRLKGEIEIL